MPGFFSGLDGFSTSSVWFFVGSAWFLVGSAWFLERSLASGLIGWRRLVFGVHRLQNDNRVLLLGDVSFRLAAQEL